MTRLILSSLMVIAIASCAYAAPTPENSGIEGQVLIGPMCPVMREGQDCPDTPYQATISVVTIDGKKVTRFQTDENGLFHVPIAPGEYILHPESPSQLPYAAEQTVTVESDLFTYVTIHYDSGIR